MNDLENILIPSSKVSDNSLISLLQYDDNKFDGKKLKN